MREPMNDVEATSFFIRALQPVAPSPSSPLHQPSPHLLANRPLVCRLLLLACSSLLLACSSLCFDCSSLRLARSSLLSDCSSLCLARGSLLLACRHTRPDDPATRRLSLSHVVLGFTCAARPPYRARYYITGALCSRF